MCMYRERKRGSLNGVAARACCGGTGRRSQPLVPQPRSLPGGRRGAGGSGSAASGHLLPGAGPGAAPSIPFSLLPTGPSPPGAGPAGAERSPLPWCGTPRTFLPRLRGSAGGSERRGGGGLGWARPREGKKRPKADKQTDKPSRTPGTFHARSQLSLESYFLNCQRGVAPFRTLPAAARQPPREPAKREESSAAAPGRVRPRTAVTECGGTGDRAWRPRARPGLGQGLGGEQRG